MKNLLFPLAAIAFALSGCDSPQPESIFTIPFEHVQIPNTGYQILGDRDTVLSYPSGTQISIPKDAFLDSAGNPVKGKVDFVYREFPTPFDIYLGGIPMAFDDSSGVDKVFETAGMIEANAYAGGKALTTNPNSRIRVDMNSFKGGDFNLYELDTVSGKWTYLGRNEERVENYEEQIAALPEVPAPPRRARKQTFHIVDTAGLCPELKIYENVYFEPIDQKYMPTSRGTIQVTPKSNGITLSSSQITPVLLTSTATLSLSRGRTTIGHCAPTGRSTPSYWLAVSVQWIG